MDVTEYIILWMLLNTVHLTQIRNVTPILFLRSRSVSRLDHDLSITQIRVDLDLDHGLSLCDRKNPEEAKTIYQNLDLDLYI